MNMDMPAKEMEEHLLLPISLPTKGAGGKTGSWRVFRPVIIEEKCVKCMLCWMYCPEAAIEVKSRKEVPKINYDYCKGCLICMEVCPVKAIKSEREG